jgi:hypothetical protein
LTDFLFEATMFEKGGPGNTENAVKIAKKYADQLNIKDIVFASTTGSTAEKVLEIFDSTEYNLVCITHSYHFVVKGGKSMRQEFDEIKMEKLKNKGLKLFSGTHSMAGIDRNIRMKFNQWDFVDLMAKFLRENFSQGTKVCMEIASMAVDAGYIQDIEKDIICIGGTGRGADTVCLIKPAPTSMFDTLRVKAIFAKPQ